MDDVAPEPPTYRLGYREGFRDGFAESVRQRAEEQKHAKGDDDDGGEKSAGGDDQKSEENEKGADKEDGDGKDGDEKGKDGDGKEKDENEVPLYKRPLLVGGALVVLLALVIAAIVFWRHSKHHESTDDAFIDGMTSQIAAQTAGRVSKLYITDNQLVKAGDALLDIDSRDDDTRITNARSQLAGTEGQFEQAQAQVGVRRASAAEADASARQSEAELTKAAQDLARYRSVDPAAVPKQEVDAAQAAERSARARLDATRGAALAAHAQVEAALAQVRAGRAQVEASRASLQSAELQRSYTHVIAPIAGRVTKRSVEPGNVIANGQALMALVGESLWVTANYKETQLTHMQPGQSVEIVVDAFPDVAFKGHVDSIQRATGAYFSALPAENATGNYVKVVQRVPVKIVFDDDKVRNYAIGPGMSVRPDVSLP